MRALSALMLVCVLWGPVFAQGAPSDERALRELWQRFEEAFNRYDAAKVANLYAVDGDRIGGDFEVARGRAEIARQYDAYFTSRRKDPTKRPLRARLAIRFLRPDVGLLDGTWDDLESGDRVTNHFTVVVTKQMGRWQIAAGRVRGTQRHSRAVEH